jgi:glycosyltransferase involved in cell wall biosynthesis
VLRHQNIICFAGKDWEDDPTSNDHIMRRLARDNNVAWLDSIGIRTPNWRTARDIRKAGRKLLARARGVRTAHSAAVHTPFLLPFPHNRAAEAINRRLLARSVDRIRRGLGMESFQLWCFTPTVAAYSDLFGASLVIYYCTDEWSKFRNVDAEAIGAMDRQLCERSDLVFVTAEPLLASRQALNPETHLALHGVDHRHFASALSASVEVAPEIRTLKPPVLGFVGKLEYWVDIDLVAGLAARKPDASIVLIGPAAIDTTPLERFANVHLLGRIPYADLPRYVKGFDAALIPFVVNDLTRSVNPIKLREYLSAGVPVVSTPLPEVLRYDGLCTFGANGAEFAAAVDAALARDSREARRARSRAMEQETWECRIEALSAHVERVQAKGRGRRNAAG